MTCREKLKIEHPELVDDGFIGGCCSCPDDYGYLDIPGYCNDPSWTDDYCTKCWSREIPETGEKEK